MLSLFPYLLNYEGYAPLLLRLVLGGIFIYWAYQKYKKRKNSNQVILGGVEGIIGVFLVVGFLTQLVALISAIIFAVYIAKKIKDKTFLTDGVNYYLILFIISITLMLTGAGFKSIDLPL